jgi:hypothetical protein
MRTLLVLPNTRMTESFVLSPLPPPSEYEPADRDAPPSGTAAAGAPPDSVQPPPPAPKIEAQPHKRVSPLVYAGFGVGGAGLVVGSVTGLLSLARASDAKQFCDGNACRPAAQDDRDASLNLAKVSNVSFAIGGVGAAVGLVAWLLLTPRGTGVTVRRQPNVGLSEVSPLVGDRWLGLAGRF